MRILRRPALVAGFVLSLLVVLIPFSYAGATTPNQMAAMPMAQSQATDQLPPNPGCSPDFVPVGQANPPGSQLEPLRPIWCFTLAAPGAPTRISGANDWVDNFQTVTQMGRFADGDYDYRVFDDIQSAGGATSHTQHFTNNQHWMDDNAGGSLGGTMIRPSRSFTFENGKLVVEADVAAGITGYVGGNGGDTAWPEIDISTASSPIGNPIDDPLYAYGRFGGFDTVGCRLNSGGGPICSYEAARGRSPSAGTEGQPPCFDSLPARLYEISWFEQCGTIHSGGLRSGGTSPWRQCSSAAQVPDMMCRDRFRMEITKSSLTLFVNGQQYFQDASMPSKAWLPDALVNGTMPVYLYLSDWQDSPDQPAYRFHWQRIAVNPHSADGSIAAPSASPSFCAGQPGNTCMSAATNTPIPATTLPTTNTSVPSTQTAIPPTSTTVPSTSTAVPATSTPLPSTPTAQPTASVGIGPMTCALNIDANGNVTGSCIKN